MAKPKEGTKDEYTLGDKETPRKGGRKHGRKRKRGAVRY